MASAAGGAEDAEGGDFVAVIGPEQVESGGFEVRLREAEVFAEADFALGVADVQFVLFAGAKGYAAIEDRCIDRVAAEEEAVLIDVSEDAVGGVLADKWDSGGLEGVRAGRRG